ncbi:hypothetical protein [Streptomyces sp. NPDC048603]|uniref:hypothetical protein n=1 Tax=Streptomyces sp. NPDC048603 TaxID=3365577 RepID=UPI00372090CD
MKQSAVKTLGVAVLGVAAAAAAAGSASASSLPALNPTDALGMVATTAEGLTHQQQGAQQGGATDPGAAVGQVTGLLGGLPLPGGIGG